MIFPLGPRPAALRRGIVVLLVAIVAIAPAAFGARARARSTPKKEAPEGSYKGVIVIDAASGATLFEDRADEVSPPASMTKLMTFAVLSDKLASGAITLDTPVKIDRTDANMGGTQVFLDPRETFSVEELIYAMMIQSANDAAHALARASAGSAEAFVELMNQKARELGMAHTTFRSPHGLPFKPISAGDLTTPRDFAILSRYLLLHTDVLKYTSVKERVFAPNRIVGKPQNMKNHNKLLWECAGTDGLKTGYTEGAGYCLSATVDRNGHRIVLVIMGAFGPNGQIDKGVWRDRKAIALIERALSAIPATAEKFDVERSKYTKPSVISLDGATGPAAPAPAEPSANAPAAPAPAQSSEPSVKFELPHR
jgi:D-alanyl-D-alanine carboxypeptidase